MANPVSVSQCPSTITLEQHNSLNELCSQVVLTEYNEKVVQSAKDKVIRLLADTPLLQPQLSALLSRLDEYQVRVIERQEDHPFVTVLRPDLESELPHLIALDEQVREMQDIQDLKQRESSLSRVEKQVSEMVSKAVWKPFTAQFISIQQHLSRFKDRCAMLDPQRMKLNCYGLRQLIHTLTKEMRMEQRRQLNKHSYDCYVQECAKNSLRNRLQEIIKGNDLLRKRFAPLLQKESHTISQAAYHLEAVTKRSMACHTMTDAITRGSEESAIRRILENPTRFGDTWDFSEPVTKVMNVAMLNILMEAGVSIETLNDWKILEKTLGRLGQPHELPGKELAEATQLAQFLLKIGVDPNPFFDISSEQAFQGCYQSRLIFDLVRRMQPQIFESWLPKLVDVGLDVNSLELTARVGVVGVITPLQIACFRANGVGDGKDPERYLAVRALVFNGAIVTSHTEYTSKTFHRFDRLDHCVKIYQEASSQYGRNTVIRIQRLAEILRFPNELLTLVNSYFDVVAEIRRICYEIEQKDTTYPIPSLNEV